MNVGRRAGATAVLTAVLVAAGGAEARAALTLVGQWGGNGSADGQFQFPHGLTVDGGNVYVADGNNSRIQRFTTDGAFVLKWGSFGSANNQLGSPTDVATDSAGNVYVADAGNYRVQKFTASGQYIQTIGQLSGTNPPPPGQFQSNTQGVAYAPNGDIYVTERWRVNQFRTDGTFVRRWGDQGPADGQFNASRGIAVDGSGNVYVADCSNSRVQVFAADGTFLRRIGTSGSAEGQFGCPWDVAIDPAGDLWVADSSQYSIQQFKPDGTFVSRTTTNDITGGFRPDGIAFDSAGFLYVTDVQANTGSRVLKFQPGPEPLPPPVIAETVNVAVERGTVRVKFPPGTTSAGLHAAQSGFVRLTAPAQIPVGSIVDTRKGQVGLTSAADNAGNVQSGSFYDGQFKLTQQRSGLTQVRLNQKLTCGKARKSGATAARRTRRLWGRATGRFRTRGRHSSATVRGTKWLVKDTCSSTTTLVRQGTVIVRDFRKRRTVRLRRGQRYIARATKGR